MENRNYGNRGRREETSEDLRRKLRRIDHRGYPAYKDLRGQYDFGGYRLFIDHVQGDPFAAPSHVSVHLSGRQAGFPGEWLERDCRRIALQDELLRRFGRAIGKYSRQAGGSGKSGVLSCSRPGQEILERSACQFDPKSGALTVRFLVGFPAAGRTVLAGELEKILFNWLPACVEEALLFSRLPAEKLKAVCDLADDQEALRNEVRRTGLVAFVADGSVLPRESGISQRPMKNAVPFRSPEEDRVTFKLPHRGTVTGMGIPAGITLIIGGGYHGKSTLLNALERGIYNHIAGDGREFIVTDRTAVKIRAEDGRCVNRDDISLFIRSLPNGKSTADFSTEDASGSTSQAASCVEAIAAGAGCLLMDEDTCATNFMVRDSLMQRIVSPEEEPIIPYLSRMRALGAEGVSTVLVAGSSGDFFRVADRVIQMNQYVPRDVTKKVREILSENGVEAETGEPECGKDRSVRESGTRRCPQAGPEFRGRNGRGPKSKVLGPDGFMIGRGTVDLRGVEQIADSEQLESLCRELIRAAEHGMDGRTPVKRLAEEMESEIRKTLRSAAGDRPVPGNLAEIRSLEIAAAVDRCRMLRWK